MLEEEKENSPDLLQQDLLRQLSCITTQSVKSNDITCHKNYKDTNLESGMCSSSSINNEAKWVQFHLSCNIVLFFLNLAVSVLLYFHYHRPVCKWSLVFLGSSSSVMGIYFFWNLQRLTHPRTVYLSMRWLNVLYYISLSLQPFLLIVTLADDQNNWMGSHFQLVVTKCLLYIILTITSLELLLCFSLLSGFTCVFKLEVFALCGPCCGNRIALVKPISIGLQSYRIEMTRYHGT